MEEIKKDLMLLIREGHEAVINDEEAEEYQKKVADFVDTIIGQAIQEELQRVVREIVGEEFLSEENPLGDWYKTGYYVAKQEIKDKAKHLGIDIK